MGIIIDIILVAILLISAFLGYKKGLVKLGTRLFAGIIAIIITIILYIPISEIIINNTQIDEKIQSTFIQNTTSILNKENEQNNNIEEKVTNNITNHITNEIIPQEANKISKNIVKAITAIVLFIIIKIILSIIISLLDCVANLPLLKQFNEIGGIIYGLVRGIIIIAILVILMSTFARINPSSKVSNNIQNSYITKFLYKNFNIL